jgi:hypothetical protein
MEDITLSLDAAYALGRLSTKRTSAVSPHWPLTIACIIRRCGRMYRLHDRHP